MRSRPKCQREHVILVCHADREEDEEESGEDRLEEEIEFILEKMLNMSLVSAILVWACALPCMDDVRREFRLKELAPHSKIQRPAQERSRKLNW